jgi:ketosteroid isomerase-like protein
MTKTRDELCQVVQRYIGLLKELDADNRRDIDALVALMTPDIHYEIPFLERPLVIDGREAVRNFLEAAQGMFAAISYDVTRMLVDEAEQAVIVEMRSDRTILPDKYRYANRYVLIFTVRNGLIADFQEYLNPLPAARVSARLELD